MRAGYRHNMADEEQPEREPGEDRPTNVRVEDESDATQDVPSPTPTTSGAGERPPPPPE